MLSGFIVSTESSDSFRLIHISVGKFGERSLPVQPSRLLGVLVLGAKASVPLQAKRQPLIFKMKRAKGFAFTNS